MVTALDRLSTTDVLFLNWRGPGHPQAGGAEAYCFEMARRFADAGAAVTVFTARHPGAVRRTVQEDGVRILRGGGAFGVYAAAAWHMLSHRHAYDAVIDFQNGIPFYSPLFTPRWTADICVIHHVHQEQFDVWFPWPLNAVGRFMEKRLSRWVYRGRPIVVVSPSTREGIRRVLGFRNPTHIVPNGAPEPLASDPAPAPVAATPTVAVVSRLVPHKRVDLLIGALPKLLAGTPRLRVDICGTGEALPRLREYAARLGVAQSVTFHGHVGEERKREVLARAWLTVVPSAAEGWGLTVIEANALGKPALAFDVPGLRDAVLDGSTGWLLAPGTDLADGVQSALEQLADPAERERWAERCRRWSRAFSWDHSAERLAAVVVEELHRIHRHRRSRRRTVDLTVRTRFHAGDGNADAMERALRRGLRDTDEWDRSGTSFQVLLHGCDEVQARAVLRRLGVSESEISQTRLAGRRDLLLGGKEGS
ncbi:glycosyltransferase family 4 protein [Streptomyces sp. NPDC096205]|uniref:glycosyltransferase family 4 protein n=1 Tax=Streptomyces sp. NPDC096205 TaxID=3366081 RepID=UPI00381EAE7C